MGAGDCAEAGLLRTAPVSELRKGEFCSSSAGAAPAGEDLLQRLLPNAMLEGEGECREIGGEHREMPVHVAVSESTAEKQGTRIKGVVAGAAMRQIRHFFQRKENS